MRIELQPVRLAGEAGAAHLMFGDGELLAVLLELSDQYDELRGGWHVEATFGALADLVPPSTFPDLAAAQGWVETAAADLAQA